jgi:hypothetical protein
MSQVTDETLRYLIGSHRLRTNGDKRLKYVNVSGSPKITPTAVDDFLQSFTSVRVLIVTMNLADYYKRRSHLNTNLFVSIKVCERTPAVWWDIYPPKGFRSLTLEDIDYALQPIRKHSKTSEIRRNLFNRVFEDANHQELKYETIKYSDGSRLSLHQHSAWAKLTVRGFSKKWRRDFQLQSQIDTRLDLHSGCAVQ